MEPPDIRSIDSFLPVPSDDQATTGRRRLTDDEAQFALMVGFGIDP
ncbi:hypothetical protein [Crateriforma conspicua]|nr:hypothetical protein [Crateriforma conspicua]